MGLRVAAFLLCTVLLPAAAQALDVPPLRGRVNDLAGMLSPQAAQALETELAALERTDSTQIVVLTVKSLEGEALEEYSIKVAEQWKIGQKGLDNGAILLVARNDRKIRIEVGRGLEGKLTDLMTGRIIRHEIIPHFKDGDYSGGIETGVRALIAAAKGEYTASDKPGTSRDDGDGGTPLFVIGIVFLIVISIIGKISKILSGAAGAVGLPIAGAIFLPAVGLPMLLILAGVGLVAGLIIPMLAGMSGGGFMGGGFGGFGGGSSGGDGGFSGGGGDFGGGGASDSW
ncbi:MAG: methanol dehydrogenase [Spirochaetes bacterium]|nr:MAG: methanol dehydrogenase [Spirochaetota bacterium]